MGVRGERKNHKDFSYFKKTIRTRKDSARNEAAATHQRNGKRQVLEG